MSLTHSEAQTPQDPEHPNDTGGAEAADAALRRLVLENPSLAEAALRQVRGDEPLRSEPKKGGFSTRTKAIAGGLAALTAAAGGYFTFGRSGDFGTMPHGSQTNTSTPLAPSKTTAQETALPSQEVTDDLNNAIFPGFLPEGSGDPATNTETIRGIDAVSNATKFFHPPIGDENPLLVKLSVAGGMYRYLGYFVSATGQDPKELNDKRGSEFTTSRNTTLAGMARDNLFNDAGAASPFGRAYFNTLTANTSALLQRHPEDAVSYGDMINSAAFGDGQLTRGGGVSGPVQTYEIEWGLPSGDRFKVFITGRYDDNGQYLWKITDSEQLGQ